MRQSDNINIGRERCFLVAAIMPGRYGEPGNALTELRSLVDTAGGEVVGELTQKLDRPHTRTFLGKGKFEELGHAVRETGADTVVVDDDLTPTQLSALEESCRRKVIDRSEVIIDIFNARARSHQAKLQVELAQLQYELPRLARKWTHLERLGGGIGTRGPGESQIETDRRIIRRKIAQLRRELDEIEARKVREVGSRRDRFAACLVGYTNAGKSTLLKRLTDAEPLIEDRLFATLDTLTRQLELPGGEIMLLSDTVGFIERLPHHLMASFHATLEEAAQADLLLHVIDAASPDALAHVRAVDQALREIGLYERERLYVLNKADAVTDQAICDRMRELLEPSVLVSARTGGGTDELLALLERRAMSGRQTCILRFPAGDGKRLAVINEVGNIHDLRYVDSETVVRVTLAEPDLERLKRLPGRMRIETAKSPPSTA